MHRKSLVLIVALFCCLCVQTSYALPAVTKQCPDCSGRGYYENWYGGRETCSNCNGSGKVANPLGVMFVICAVIYGISRLRK